MIQTDGMTDIPSPNPAKITTVNYQNPVFKFLAPKDIPTSQGTECEVEVNQTLSEHAEEQSGKRDQAAREGYRTERVLLVQHTGHLS